MGSLRWKELAVMWTGWASLILFCWMATACAGAPVKWWFNDSKDAKALVRKHTNAATETLSYTDADGYLCLSPPDAELAIFALKQLKQ